MLIFIIILGVLIIVHEFGHFIMAKFMGVRVEKFCLGFGPKIIGGKKGETEYAVNAIPLGGYVKMAGDVSEEYKGQSGEYLSKKPGQRAAIVLFGPLLNYFLGFLCFWVIFSTGYYTFTNKVGNVLDGFGAQQAGIQAGDRIAAIEGRGTSCWDDLQEAVRQNSRGDKKSLKVLVIRGENEFIFDVPLKNKEANDFLGRKQKLSILGVEPSGDTLKVKHGAGKAFVAAADKTWQLTQVTYQALWMMLSGKLSFARSVTGPLGIYMMTKQAASMGFAFILQWIGILSVSLAIFNLLPLPVLDGGHIFLLALERIRGKPLSVKTERVITQAGMVLIISLALFVTYNDIVRLFGNKIGKFFAK